MFTTLHLLFSGKGVFSQRCGTGAEILLDDRKFVSESKLAHEDLVI